MDSNLKSRLNACFENVLSEWNQELSQSATQTITQSTTQPTSVVFMSVLLFLCGLCLGALITFYWLEESFAEKEKEDD